MDISKIEVVIFSFNRGTYLKNAVESVLECMPSSKLRVFDDNSDDPATVEYLATLGDTVISNHASGKDRHGGLYANMQRAFETATSKFMLVMQDDMQIVRSVDARDEQDLENIFAHDPQCMFVSPLFMQAGIMRRYRRQLQPFPDRQVYDTAVNLSAKNYRRRIAYYDVCLWNVDRLRQTNWKMLPAERANNDYARASFSTMPFMKNPFFFFCPEVPFFRHRTQTLAAKMAARFVGSNLKRFSIMTAQQVKLLRDRDLSIWPVAEDFLTVTDPSTVKPFVFRDVDARWWLYWLHRIEIRLFRRV